MYVSITLYALTKAMIELTFLKLMAFIKTEIFYERDLQSEISNQTLLIVNFV